MRVPAPGRGQLLGRRRDVRARRVPRRRKVLWRPRRPRRWRAVEEGRQGVRPTTAPSVSYTLTSVASQPGIWDLQSGPVDPDVLGVPLALARHGVVDHLPLPAVLAVRVPSHQAVLHPGLPRRPVGCARRRRAQWRRAGHRPGHVHRPARDPVRVGRLGQAGTGQECSVRVLLARLFDCLLTWIPGPLRNGDVIYFALSMGTLLSIYEVRSLPSPAARSAHLTP